MKWTDQIRTLPRGPAIAQMIRPSTGNNRISRIHNTLAPVLAPLLNTLLDDEIQAVLVYGKDLPRVLELCAEVGINAEPSLEALRIALHV